MPTLLNLAPVPADAEAAVQLAARADWLVVNESEAAALLGRPVAGLAGAAEAAAALRDLLTAAASPGAKEAGHAAADRGYAVVTAGSHGAALAGPDGAEQVPGFAVASVDAVGAGDAFVAALAVGLAAGAAPPRRCARPAPPGPPPPPGGAPRPRCPGRPASRRRPGWLARGPLVTDRLRLRLLAP